MPIVGEVYKHVRAGPRIILDYRQRMKEVSLLLFPMATLDTPCLPGAPIWGFAKAPLSPPSSLTPPNMATEDPGLRLHWLPPDAPTTLRTVWKSLSDKSALEVSCLLLCSFKTFSISLLEAWKTSPWTSEAFQPGTRPRTCL